MASAGEQTVSPVSSLHVPWVYTRGGSGFRAAQNSPDRAASGRTQLWAAGHQRLRIIQVRYMILLLNIYSFYLHTLLSLLFYHLSVQILIVLNRCKNVFVQKQKRNFIITWMIIWGQSKCQSTCSFDVLMRVLQKWKLLKYLDGQFLGMYLNFTKLWKVNFEQQMLQIGNKELNKPF